MELILIGALYIIFLLKFLSETEIGEYLDKKEKNILKAFNILVLISMYYMDVNFTFIFVAAIISVSAFIDYKHGEIPNIAAIYALVIAIVNCCIHYKNLNLVDMTLGVFIYFIFFIACLIGLIGGGDVKLFFPIMILFGGLEFIIFLVISSFIVLVVNIPRIFLGDTKLNSEVRLAPYFYIAYCIVCIGIIQYI